VNSLKDIWLAVGGLALW